MYPCFGKLCVKEFIVESPRLEQQSGSALVPDGLSFRTFRKILTILIMTMYVMKKLI